MKLSTRTGDTKLQNQIEYQPIMIEEHACTNAGLQV